MNQNGRGVEELKRCDPSHLLMFAQEARRRQAMYRLLGSVYLYPDKERLETLRIVADELSQENYLHLYCSKSERLCDLLDSLASVGENPNAHIEEDYVSLFSVNPQAPPYESYYRDPEGFKRGWISIQIEREYAETGLNLSESYKDLPDHIAVELEFMAFLCAREALAFEDGDENEAVLFRNRQSTFLHQHLKHWIPQFAQKVIGEPSESLYLLVVLATDEFLQQELAENKVNNF